MNIGISISSMETVSWFNKLCTASSCKTCQFIKQAGQSQQLFLINTNEGKLYILWLSVTEWTKVHTFTVLIWTS